MFADAYEIAAEWTAPVIVAQARTSGQVQTSIGSFIIVNDEGWAITAAHIVHSMVDTTRAANEHRARTAARQAIEADQSLSRKARKEALRKLPTDTGIVAGGTLWAGVTNTLTQVHVIPQADLAFVRLEQPPSVPRYPVFKDPEKALRPGTSLMRLGFPFHHVEASYDLSADAFILPAGAFPIPRFPIEGIMTRHGAPKAQPDLPFPVCDLETSSPGLRGQSGGPIVDRKGTIWAVQSVTASLELGFSPKASRGSEEHQFLNVGRGPSVVTIVPAMRHFGIRFALATY